MSNGNPDITRLLLEHDADVEAQVNGHVAPLHLAARNGWRESIQVLNHDANVHARDKWYHTPFEVASTREVMKLLHEHELSEPKNTA
jgi:ankyrin repeat protein